ncbi:hypothetical protein EKN30_24050 [Enterobacter asburiae]|nr:hypothetical protein EKN30_24050 [Enterobacter asburiae]
MNSFLHQASFATGYWYYDRHRSVRLVILVGLAIDQIAQSGLSSLSVIYYSAQLFSCRSNILWISDDFENECAYYISKDSKLSLENSVLALIQSVLQTLNLNEEQCTLMGFSKGGSAALYYGLKFNFKNIIASCPQLHIGSYVSRHWPNVANNMMGNNYDQGDINILDNLIPDLLKKQRNKDQHIYLITSLDDEQYSTEIAPYINDFNEHQNFNFVITKSHLAWQHNKVTRYNLPIILSIVYANGEGVSPVIGKITNGYQSNKINEKVIASQRQKEVLVSELSSISYSDGKIYPKGVSFIRGFTCERYDQIKQTLILFGEDFTYEFPLGKFIQKENNYRYYESEFCDYSAASFTSLGNKGIDITSIAQGSYTLKIKTTAGNVTKSNPLMLKRHYEEYHLIDSSELYFHSSSSGTQIIKRPILDNINNIIFSVE